VLPVPELEPELLVDAPLDEVPLDDVLPVPELEPELLVDAPLEEPLDELPLDPPLDPPASLPWPWTVAPPHAHNARKATIPKTTRRKALILRLENRSRTTARAMPRARGARSRGIACFARQPGVPPCAHHRRHARIRSSRGASR
jgi:hypothetical protein